MHRSLLSLALFAVLPFAASAADTLSYDYAEAGYVRSDAHGDADGWGANASWSIGQQFHVFGSYIDQSADVNYQSPFAVVDWRQYTLGVGYRRGINANTDLVARLGWSAIDTDFTQEKNGVTAEAGMRSALGERLEAFAMAGYGDVDVSGGGGEFYGKTGMYAKFGAHWGVAGDVTFISGDTQWFVGPRIHW